MAPLLCFFCKVSESDSVNRLQSVTGLNFGRLPRVSHYRLRFSMPTQISLAGELDVTARVIG